MLRHWALTSSVMGGEPTAGAEGGCERKMHEGAEGEIGEGDLLKKRGKKGVSEALGVSEEKVEGRVTAVTYHIVYHIQKSQVCLSSWSLR